MEAQDNIIILSKENRQYLAHHFLNICCVSPLNDSSDFRDIDDIIDYLTGNIKKLQPDYEIANLSSFKAYVYSSVLPKSKYGVLEMKRNVTLSSILKKPLCKQLTEYCFVFNFNNKYELNTSIVNTFSSPYFSQPTTQSASTTLPNSFNSFQQPSTSTQPLFPQTTNTTYSFSQNPYKFTY